ncbi:hypothetical protein P22_3330 [Propionispora sp. 2/2-37]|nr:hypothetical protein P22_3330 [Propionispora sp. 2/2-37]
MEVNEVKVTGSLARTRLIHSDCHLLLSDK